MSEPRDLEPKKRIGLATNTLVVGHPHAIMGHSWVVAGGSGPLYRKQCQQRYYDSNNHPLDTHVGLPDLGPEWQWEREQISRAPYLKFHSNQRSAYMWRNIFLSNK